MFCLPQMLLGAMPSLDLLSTLQQNVAEGNLTEEEAVAEFLKKMRTSGAATVRSVILHMQRDPACMKGKKFPSLL